MNLTDFMFPVGFRKTIVHNGNNDIIDVCNGDTYLQPDVKSIVRLDTNEYIATVGENYKVVTNEELITKSVEQFDDYGFNYVIDNVHSFCNNRRMKLALKFPDISFNDGRSNVNFSIYLHNSYNRSEGIRLFMGFLRLVCSNGVIVGKLLGRYYHRHTNGVALDAIGSTVAQSIEGIPKVRERIEELKSEEVKLDEELERNLIEVFGKTCALECLKMLSGYFYQQTINKYLLLNAITYYISHHVSQQQRTLMQLKIAKEFDL